MDQKKTGQFLKMLRNEKGLTQEQLAKEFNVTNRSVSRWETGSNLPDISLLVEIADFYDVDVREIIDGERKSENMEEQVREVANKMADYASTEKNKLLTFIQIIGIFGIGACFMALFFQIKGYKPDLSRFCGIVWTLLILVIMSIITLYVMGVLQKIAKKKKMVKTLKTITIVIVAVGAVYTLIIIGIVALFYFSVVIEKIEVYTDPSEYNQFIHTSDEERTIRSIYGPQFDVLPQDLNGDLKVTEYQYTYYNPWDPQYVVYMTLDYGTEAYEEEIARLESIGVDDYARYYSVTGEPEGYDLVAMESDEYQGFVYAMIPEGDTDNTKITYVCIWFCNYLLDLDIHKYIPDQYLLTGFDATENNPYRKSILSQDQDPLTQWLEAVTEEE
ncbi:MAG: helix-turn-helix transcriptional regulator [Clostridiales bacterium]|nr:helix-turn-helix transcriptional regulator [Clostridiales bacterium]